MHGYSSCFKKGGAPSKDQKISDKDVRKTVINSQQLCLRISHFQNIKQMKNNMKNNRTHSNEANIEVDTEAANSSSLHSLV